MFETLERPTRRAALRRLASGGLAVALAAGGLGRTTERVKADDLPDAILDWFGAWTSDDAPREVAALYPANGGFSDVPSGAYVLTPDIEEYLRSAPVRPATVNRYFRRAFAADGLAAVDQLLYATNEPFAPGAPAGASFEVFAVTIFEYDNRGIRWSTDYYDFDSILRQVGIPPNRASAITTSASASRCAGTELFWA
jgi:hypothetical protein